MRRLVRLIGPRSGAANGGGAVVIGADHPSRSNVAEPLNTLDSVQNGATVVESRADDYRCRAEQCLEMATTFHNHQARDILLHMAHVWLRLAEDNHEMVARSKAAEEAQPAVQQQEQIQPKKEGE
jgi:hypothetical protein